jgi:serpin B
MPPNLFEPLPRLNGGAVVGRMVNPQIILNGEVLMKRIAVIAIFGTSLMSGLASLHSAQPPAKLDPQTADLVKGSTTFAVELYDKLRSGNGNLFFSPYSISNALAMTYAGARGQTATEMAATLHFNTSGLPLHAAYADLIKELNRPGQKRKYQLSVANRLWGQTGYGFAPDFLKLTHDSYGASLEELDFVRATEQARKTINGWVEKETQARIKDLLAPGTITPDIRLVLTNAIYFKAQWADAFSEKTTKKEDFKLGEGKTVNVDMMQITESANLFESDALQMLELPYEQHELSMLVLLPRQIDGLGNLEKQLSTKSLEQWTRGLKRQRVMVQLPRFKFTAEFKLRRVLSEMGMALAFSKNADFSGMATGEKLGIDDVIHKAFVAVDEKGTEAAAATAVTIRTLGAPAGTPTTFRADHPFVFLVRDNRTGSILFMGRLADPTK